MEENNCYYNISLFHFHFMITDSFLCLLILVSSQMQKNMEAYVRAPIQAFFVLLLARSCIVNKELFILPVLSYDLASQRSFENKASCCKITTSFV